MRRGDARAPGPLPSRRAPPTAGSPTGGRLQDAGTMTVSRSETARLRGALLLGADEHRETRRAPLRAPCPTLRDRTDRRESPPTEPLPAPFPRRIRAQCHSKPHIVAHGRERPRRPEARGSRSAHAQRQRLRARVSRVKARLYTPHRPRWLRSPRAARGYPEPKTIVRHAGRPGPDEPRTTWRGARPRIAG